MRLEVRRKSDLVVQALRFLAHTSGRVKGPALAEAVESTSGFVSQVLNPLGLPDDRGLTMRKDVLFPAVLATEPAPAGGAA